MNATNDIELVWGAEAIALVIGAKPRQTFHLLETGQIPAKKVGGRWVADRGKLARFFMDEGETA
ncbi:DNA-binding protein [Mesorhizobium sp. M7A.F.Ca.US.010.02.1.1]|uniref:DNA-binding protein n=1 Tax=Mesorhizobium sp. M7A.F.Ca.US.010.02.1.1 TaxID=2496743 RepID=UPI000FD57CC9|nr:DNA-binding protein [Mesorhizobium sp. M7A.F.Ca.US.010.02.1.1]RUW92046.1 DNA-binding protein [Mesorhizobium sp. M7A.F.Ca.US.010.02.1.1]